MPLPRASIRWTLVAVITLLWVVCLWSFAQPIAVSHSEGAEAVSGESEPSSAPGGKRAARPGRRQPVAAQLDPLRMADLIEDVSTDKRQVCPGEDVLVTVRGKPENARSSSPIAELNFNVEGSFGNPIALSPRSPGIQKYSVVASNGVEKLQHLAFEIEVLEPESAACRSRAFATLALELDARDGHAIQARVAGVHGIADVVSYLWDFSDGEQAESSRPEIAHSYASRDQTRGLSSFVVSVIALDTAGRRAEGRASISLQNNHFRARAFGERLLQTQYDRFLRTTPQGLQTQVTLRSFEPDPVLLERVKVTQHSCLAGQPDRVRQLPLTALSGPLRIEAKAKQLAVLTFPKGLVGENTCALDLELTGDSVPARLGQALPDSPIKYRAVSARLSLEVRAAPSVEAGGAPALASRVVRDPALLAKLRQAGTVLGAGPITPEKLERLEREGKLK